MVEGMNWAIVRKSAWWRSITSNRRDASAFPIPIGSFALFRLGFRPFYLLAALYAALAVPLWVLAYMSDISPVLPLAPVLWHAHEMVFGFAVAVITGFLLTAARNWTGLPTPSGWALAGLAGLWLLARLAFVLGPIGAAIVVELVFLGLVASTLARVLGRSRNRRNYFVVALFLMFMLADIVFLLAQNGMIPVSPIAPIEAAVYLVVMLAIVMSGRVIPAFTTSAIPTARQFRSDLLDQAIVAASGLTLFGTLVQAPAGGVVFAAFSAAALHAIRWVGWNPLATGRHPLLWILHVSYAWLPIGFVLVGLAALGRVSPPLALHAFSSGAIAGLVVGMITRTALGHTGRPLVAGVGEIAMYLLVLVAGVLRVFGPMALPDWTLTLLALSAGCWTTAFLLYLIIYGPRLALSRVDGKPG